MEHEAPEPPVADDHAEQPDSDKITFNTAVYDSWDDALVAARRLMAKNKHQPDTTWYRLDLIDEASGRFGIQCSVCHKECSIVNTGNFVSTHKKQCSNFGAGRSTLGIARAKSLIAICAAAKAKVRTSNDFEITPKVVEEDVAG